jgi:putative effector of murein hydrolase
MTEFFSTSAFCIVLTLSAYGFVRFLQDKTKLVVLNPILFGSISVIAVLTLLDIPCQTYQNGCQILRFLLTPATICLSIGFYQQFQSLKQHIWAVLAGVLAGSISCLFFIYFTARFFGLDQAVIISLMPKSITTAIGTALAEELGGVAAITTFVIAITGIFGNIAGPALSKLLKIRGAIPQGVAFGTASHVMGTTRATELCALTGAVSSLSLTIAGLLTVVLLSFVAQF